jgi:hypothetical protein
MRKNPNQCDRLFAVVLAFLLSFLVEQSVLSQATVAHQSTDKNWYCLKRKDLLRDKQGGPVWLTSEELLDRVIESAPIERPGPLAKNNLRGVVSIQILINKHGKVICAQGLDGHPLAVGAAIHSVRGWTFKAFTVRGERKSVVGVLNLPYDFG